MEIVNKEILHGPNRWTKEYPNILVCNVNVNGQEDHSDEDLESIPGELQKQGIFLPEDVPHSRSEKIAVYLSSLMIELQKFTGVKKPYSFIASSGKEDEFAIGISYEWEEVAEYSAEASVRIISQLLKKGKPDINKITNDLNEIYLKTSLGATTSYLVSEAESIGIPWRRFGKSSLIILGHGIYQRKIRTAVADTTSALGLEIAGDKEETKMYLRDAMFPVPEGVTINEKKELRSAIEKIGYPIVIKPLNGNHGRGVTTNITNEEEAEFGFDLALKVGAPIVVEKFFTGSDFRFLVIDHKLAAVAKRVPAKITGNGISTIRELIDSENLNPERGDSPQHVLAPVIIDAVTEKILRSKNYFLSTVLKSGEELVLKDTANISGGGTSTDVTHLIHPENIFLAERISRIFNLDICGIDIIAKDISQPVAKRNNGVIIEVNAGPGLRMHSDPTFGTGRNVAGPLIKMLFPDNKWSVPVVAISESLISHQVAHLINAIFFKSGINTGCATREGVFFREHRVCEEDGTLPQYIQSVLFDPTVSCAILECSKDTTVKNGLGFSNCNICIMTSAVEPADGEEDLLFNEVIAESCQQDGYCMLNAEEPALLSLAFTISSTPVFYYPSGVEVQHSGLPPKSLIVKSDHEFITIYRAGTQALIHKIHIPAKTRELQPETYIPAIVAACLMNVDGEMINKALG